jgi:sporulation protein YlmC with PRC-barrel domain
MARDKDRTRRDQAGVGPDPEQARRHGLIPMREMDGFTIADGEPDIRGWDVRTLSGREIGEIEDLLVDRERGEVVMIEVEMRESGVHAEVPIRSVQLDRERKVVIVDSGDLEARPDQRPRERARVVERGDQVADSRDDVSRRVTYAARDEHPEDVERTAEGGDEVVVESRPMVEEVVVRRRPADET